MYVTSCIYVFTNVKYRTKTWWQWYQWGWHSIYTYLSLIGISYCKLHSLNLIVSTFLYCATYCSCSEILKLVNWRQHGCCFEQHSFVMIYFFYHLFSLQISLHVVDNIGMYDVFILNCCIDVLSVVLQMADVLFTLGYTYLPRCAYR